MANGSQGGSHPASGGPGGSAFAQLAQAQLTTNDLLARLLAVARFGPNSGAPQPLGIKGPADAAAKAFAERQQGLAENAALLSRLGLGGLGGSVNRTAQFAGGLRDAGMTGPAALAQRGAIPLAIAERLAGGAEKVAGYAYDKYSTDAQKARQAFRDFVPGGERIQGFTDAMTGRAAAMEENRLNEERRRLGVQSRLDQSAAMLSYNPQQAGREGLAAAYRGQSAVVGSVYDRTTSAGERAYREEQRILPLRQEEARAERALAVASRERVASQAELNRLRGTETGLQQRLIKQERQLASGDFESGTSRDDLLRTIGTTRAELQGIRGQQRGALEAVGASARGESAAQAERDKARSRTRLLGEAETLEGRVETAQGAARRLGTNPFDRQYALYSARLAKRYFEQNGTLDGLPEDNIQAARGFAPEFIDRAIIAGNAKTPEFAAGLKEFGVADFGTGDIKGDSTKAQELKRRLGEAEFRVDAESAERIAATGRSFGAELDKLIAKALKEALNEVERRQKLGRGER